MKRAPINPKLSYIKQTLLSKWRLGEESFKKYPYSQWSCGVQVLDFLTNLHPNSIVSSFLHQRKIFKQPNCIVWIIFHAWNIYVSVICMCLWSSLSTLLINYHIFIHSFPSFLPLHVHVHEWYKLPRSSPKMVPSANVDHI